NLTRPGAGPVAGRLADRFGSAWVILPASLLAVAGQIGVMLLGASPAIVFVCGSLLLLGSGLAMMQTANLRQLYASLPRSQLHLAPSLNLVVTTMGTTFGQATGSMLVERISDSASTAVEFVDGVGEAVLGVLAVFVLGMLLTQVMP